MNKSWLLIGLLILAFPLLLAGNPLAKPFSGLIVKFSEPIPAGIELRVRTLEKTGWSSWTQVEPDEDAGKGPPEVLLNVNESTDYQYQWTDHDMNLIPPTITIEPLNYGQIKSMHPSWTAGVSLPSSVNIISRETWGADEELLYANPENPSQTNGETEETGGPEFDGTDEIERVVTENSFGRPYRWPLKYAKEMKIMVLHHTASVKNLDNPEVAIQNIYYYHSVRRGWGDIGYNYLIDPKGNIYEGRYGGNKIIAGHVYGMNRVSVGIGVLGNYDEGEIPAEVLRSILALTNTLGKRYGIDPDGRTVYKEKSYLNIMGHRDGGNTTCPGKFLYQKLFGTRELLASVLSGANSTLFEDTESRDFIVLPPESEKTFTVQLKNKGTVTWTQASLINSNTTSIFEDLKFITSITNPLLIASLANGPIAPGQTGVFSGKIKSTISSGLFLFEPKLSVNGANPSNPAIPLAVFVQGVSPSYEIITRHDPKNELVPGETAEGYIELKNLTNVTWKNSGQNPIKLVTANPRKRISPFTGSTVLGTLSQPEVKPGDIGRFTFSLKAPTISKTYQEHFIPEISGIRYLEDKNLHLDFTVKSSENSVPIAPPSFIRIKLSFPETSAKIQGSTPIILYNGNIRLRTFTSDTIIKISKTLAGKLYVRTPTRNYILSGPVRLKNTFDTGYLSVLNWERKDKDFRRLIEARIVDGKLILVNELPLEEYLAGIAEEPNDAPYEKIKAIMVIARSYAKFYMTQAEKFPGKPYHLDDDPKNSQKYLGYGYEKRAPNVFKAVKETAGKVVTYNGKVVKTPYFSQSDGRTRSALEAFGWTNTPYLQSVDDPDCEGLEQRGHGVGLSGCGAKARALRGETFEQIIKYYYQGVEIFTQN